MNNKTYYVIEVQHRPDGMLNNSMDAKGSFASANSFYHERISKMCMNTQFTKVVVMLCDADLHVIEYKEVETMYNAVTEE